MPCKQQCRTKITQKLPGSIVWRRCTGASGSSSSKSSGLSKLSRGFSLARRPVSDGASPSAVHYTLDFPQSSPSLSTGRSTASPTSESSTTAVQVHRGGSNPLSFLSSRRQGSTLTQSRPSVVYLTDPP